MEHDSVYTDVAHCGMAGLDLAFVEQGHRYHTPRDILSAVRAGSLQALGDNVVAFASAYVESRVPVVQPAVTASTASASTSSTVYYTGAHLRGKIIPCGGLPRAMPHEAQ